LTPPSTLSLLPFDHLFFPKSLSRRAEVVVKVFERWGGCQWEPPR